MNTLFQNIISQLNDLINNNCNGCCLSLLDQTGEQVLFVKLGQPTPCSLDFSYLKAFTAYSFQQNNDEVYQSLILAGTQSLFDSKFCFIPGGLICSDQNENKYFLGVSTDVPDLDKRIALEIKKLIRDYNK